ncbi:MAG: hypothetical protein NVSMB46_09020 [Candidatus Saccharimonadales bacterium]
MIQRIEVTGIHTELTADIHKYIKAKIGKLDKFMSRHSRESVHAEVILSESKAKNKNERCCEVILHLPNGNITAKEATLNMFAAIDIVEEKLKNQLKKYKDLHDSPKLHRRLINRL